MFVDALDDCEKYISEGFEQNHNNNDSHRVQHSLYQCRAVMMCYESPLWMKWIDRIKLNENEWMVPNARWWLTQWIEVLTVNVDSFWWEYQVLSIEYCAWHAIRSRAFILYLWGEWGDWEVNTEMAVPAKWLAVAMILYMQK